MNYFIAFQCILGTVKVSQTFLYMREGGREGEGEEEGEAAKENLW